MEDSTPVGPFHRWIQGGILAAGLLLSILLLARAQATGDQFELLARGWLLVQQGEWVHYGSPTSSGGFNPGSLSSLLVAIPLLVSFDHRAPAFLILVFHFVGFLILDRTLRDAVSTRTSLVYAFLYWLSPVRIYFSGFLFNPSYLFLFGAVHLATAWRQRERGSFGMSFLHVLVIGLAFQLHASFLLLVAATVALLAGRMIRLHAGGAVTGAFVSAALLIPWMAAAIADPSILPGSSGFLGRGLLYVFPVLRGALYWLRYGGLDISSKLLYFDFSLVTGPAADAAISPVMTMIARFTSLITLVLALVANVSLWRRRSDGRAEDGRVWLSRYARRCFLAAMVVFALSPTTVMYWQGVLVFHAAVIPVALYVDELLTRRRSLVARAAAGWFVMTIILVVAMAFGSNQFRCNGLKTINGGRKNDHPMLHQLGVHADCRVEIYPEADPLPSVLYR